MVTDCCYVQQLATTNKSRLLSYRTDGQIMNEGGLLQEAAVSGSLLPFKWQPFKWQQAITAWSNNAHHWPRLAPFKKQPPKQ